MRIVVRTELERIYKRDGVLEPEAVLADAEDPTSPLHRYFEWDDGMAAHKHRIAQAMLLIRTVKIRVEVTPQRVHKVRAFVSVPRENGRSYEALEDALQDAPTREVVMEQCVRELAAIRNKYKALCDVDKAWEIASTRKIRRKAA